MLRLNSQFVVSADIPNKNNRIYPKDVLVGVVRNFKPVMVGYLGMPQDAFYAVGAFSHLIEKLEISEHNDLVADIQILDTGQGNALLNLLSSREIAFRMQGFGTIDIVDGSEVVGSDYKLVAINAVPAGEAS